MKNYTVKSVDLYKLRDIIKSMSLSATVLNYKDIKSKCAAAAEIIDTIKGESMNTIKVLDEEEIELKWCVISRGNPLNGVYFFDAIKKVTENKILWGLKSVSGCFNGIDVIDVEINDDILTLFKIACDDYESNLADSFDEGI